MSASDKHPIETIKLSDRDKVKLTQALDAQAHAGKPVEAERRALRVGFHGRRMLITIYNAAGVPVRYSVVPRNISRGGLAFVHGQFIYPNTACSVAIPCRSGKAHALDGRIVRCRHVGGIVHEVSVAFDHKLDLNEFVELTPEQSETVEREAERDRLQNPTVDHDQPHARVLVVDDFAADRKLFRHRLEKLQLQVDEAPDRGVAVQSVDKHDYQIALVDMNLGGESGIDLIRQLRTGGFEGPIVGVSADDSDQTAAKATEAGANAFLVKPCDPGQLNQVITQLLSSTAGNDAAVVSTMAWDKGMRPLIGEFVASLADQIAAIEQATEQSKHEVLRQVCRQLKGAGTGYGFEVITQSADAVLQSLQQDQKQVDKVRASVDELIQLLRRVRTD